MSAMKDLFIDILDGINRYYKDEGFGSDAYDEFENNPSCIGLMYTTDGDNEEYELQCSLDLEHMEYIRQYGDREVRDKVSAVDLYADFCGHYPVSWDSLYSWTMELAIESEDEL